jgi:hypothetical protein
MSEREEKAVAAEGPSEEPQCTPPQRESEKALTRMAEVFENERYQLSTMNWSSHGLLINDRSPHEADSPPHDTLM